ncbi:unnamed protein product [Spirodela intermedia]|uniref:Uncharacterized protein n=1 Tax=Spirodela intermedia TaxID=51605 RepID=A0A7I8I9K6_SPIIN|nr:unnamed protein product [Spirodela intermedia]CAA6654329.1 unnamed protein product [Spirodela intermedia]
MEQIKQENQQTTIRIEKEICKLIFANSKCETESKEEKSEVPPILILSHQDELRKIVTFTKVLEPKLRKRVEPNEELIKIFKQVQISIPLIDAIKLIPAYVNFLKELCNTSVNLMPKALYDKFKFGDLELVLLELQLADGSIKQPYGVLEDVMIKVEHYTSPIDFIVADMKIHDNWSRAPIIFERPFLATTKAMTIGKKE